jgi:molecular chaperone GrpE
MIQPEAENRPEEAAVDSGAALAEARAQAETYLSNWQRAQADFVNYRRRTEQEKAELSVTVACDIIGRLLPVVDDFERALGAVPPAHRRDNWVEGIRLIERKFKAFLEAQGLCPVPALDKPFDPYRHEAVRQAAGPEGIVVAEEQKGYTLKDKLVRPARVAVGSGEEDNAEKEA